MPSCLLWVSDTHTKCRHRHRVLKNDILCRRRLTLLLALPSRRLHLAGLRHCFRIWLGAAAELISSAEEP
jgi:hypothetical protein